MDAKKNLGVEDEATISYSGRSATWTKLVIRLPLYPIYFKQDVLRDIICMDPVAYLDSSNSEEHLLRTGSRHGTRSALAASCSCKVHVAGQAMGCCALRPLPVRL